MQYLIIKNAKYSDGQDLYRPCETQEIDLFDKVVCKIYKDTGNNEYKFSGTKKVEFTDNWILLDDLHKLAV